MKKRKFCLLILTIIAIFVLSGCNDKNENPELEKSMSEIKFLENQCITIFSNYVSGEYLTKDFQIDWNSIEEDYSVLSSSVNVILIDLANIQIPSKDIVELESQFNEINTLLKNRDINQFIGKICDCYQFVSVSILDSISQNESIKLEKQAKSSLLYVGYSIANLNQEESLRRIEQFQEDCASLNLNQEYLENNSYKVNSIFVSTQNLKNLISNGDFKNGIEVFMDILEHF